jgi:predicted RNase H-like HicB family nuclease
MKTKFTWWKDGNQFLGYLDEHPEYLTQGESFEDLKLHLSDLYNDLI